MGMCVAKWAQLQRSHLSMVLLDAHQGNQVNLCLSVGIMDGLALSATFPTPSIVSLVKKWSLPTGWECWAQSDSSWVVVLSGLMGCHRNSARQAALGWPLHVATSLLWLAPAQGCGTRGDSGQCQTPLKALAACSPLCADCDSWTSLGISHQLHEITSWHVIWQQIRQHFTDFGQGGWATFT